MSPGVIVVGIALQGDRVLLVRRGADQRLAGFWELPGGTPIADETAEERLLRAFGGELDVDVVVDDVFMQKTGHDDGADDVWAYFVRLTGEPRASRGHDQCRWVPVAELPDYTLVPADVPIAMALSKKILSVMQDGELG